MSVFRSPVTDVASLSRALEEQLGLTLKPQRGRVSAFIVDQVERPTLDDKQP